MKIETETERTEAFDALVIGAGIVGLAIARELAAGGRSVAVLDRGSVRGPDATDVAAGMLAPVGELDFGEPDLLKMNLESASIYPGLCEVLADETGIDTGYRRSGGLHVAPDADEAAVHRRMLDLQVESGLDSRWLGPGQARELEPALSPSIHGAVFAADDGSVDPRLMAEALEQSATRSGAIVRRGVEVESLVTVAGSVEGVRLTDSSEIRAAETVVCCGAETGRLEWLDPELRPPVRPVKGQVVELAGDPGDPVCQRAIVSERVYVVPRPDGRLIVGATVEERGWDRAVTAGGVHELLREAYRFLPEIGELELLRAVAGFRPGTPDNLPIVGRTAQPGLSVATGHYRNGVLLAPLTGRAVASMLSSGQDRAPGMEDAAPERFRSRTGVA
jgi:glycine oxidase